MKIMFVKNLVTCEISMRAIHFYDTNKFVKFLLLPSLFGSRLDHVALEAGNNVTLDPLHACGRLDPFMVST